MDVSAITAAVGAISLAKDLGAAALGVRNFNEIAPVIAQLNDQLLKAQGALFTHNFQLLALQEQLANCQEKTSKLEQAANERVRYSLVELSKGVFVYRLKGGIEVGAEGNPEGSEPMHHLCQRCFDTVAAKSVLQRRSFYGAISLDCSICKESFATGEIEPYSL